MLLQVQCGTIRPQVQCGKQLQRNQSQAPNKAAPVIKDEEHNDVMSNANSKIDTNGIKDEQHDDYSMMNIHPDIDTTDIPSKVFETSASLQKLVHDTNEDASFTAEILEAGAQQGLLLLDQLRASMQIRIERDHVDVQHWVKQIDLVRNEAQKTRTIVGVVGNTGAGMSLSVKSRHLFQC